MDASTLIFIIVALAGFVAVGGLGLAFAGGDVSGRTAKRVASVGASPTSRAEARLKAKNTGDVAGALLMMATHMALAALGVTFVAGVGLPRWFLGVLSTSRMKKFTEEFPNAVDIIVRGIKSGLPVHECLKVIAQESPQPLAEEFRRLVEGLGMGQDLTASLDKMYARMPTSEVRFFSIVLSIQQKTGGNLAEALGNLSTVLRARKLMKEKIKALSGEAVASAWIIGSLPIAIVTLVSITSPPYMKPMFTDPRGHIALMIGAAIMAAGAFIMRRMINFKF